MFSLGNTVKKFIVQWVWATSKQVIQMLMEVPGEQQVLVRGVSGEGTTGTLKWV